MLKIGRKVHMLVPAGIVSRNGEGSFIRLKDGTIMFAFTEFLGGREDEDNARISCIFSYDEGETWTERKVLFEKSEKDVNVMSISFLRMDNGDIGAFYIVKHPDLTDTIVMRRSCDEGKSWSEPLNCLAALSQPDYFILNNDRVLRLRNGRIILPLARHTIYTDNNDLTPGEILFFCSDDDGYTWKELPSVLRKPFANDRIGFQEPGLYQMADGTLWCYIRTGMGFQFECFSADNGESWTSPQPNFFFSSPCAPMLVRDFRELTFSIFNPVPEHIIRGDDEEFWGRTPYTIAIKKQGDKAFTKERLFYLEDDLDNGYCYPATLMGEDYVLIAYYHSNNTDCCLNSTKIIKVTYDELSSVNPPWEIKN